jgi:hypothetical protein
MRSSSQRDRAKLTQKLAAARGERHEAQARLVRLALWIVGPLVHFSLTNAPVHTMRSPPVQTSGIRSDPLT